MRNFLLCLMAIAALDGYAQGTLEDYNRAYSLTGKFSNSNVYHWAQNIEWKDSSNILYYSVQTPEGQRFVTVNADDLSTQTYDSEQKMKEALNIVPRNRDRRGQRFGRQRERHWMEVDEETDAYPVASPDGKWEAYIEGFNVVLHEKNKPYTDKRVLSQDGTIGNYYSNRILWSPDSKKIFVCKRRSIEKRYVYYVESAPKDQLQPVLHKQEYAKPGDELAQRVPVIFDIEKGCRLMADTALCPNQYDLGWFQWTEDSREVTMEYNQRGHKVYRLLGMNAETGRLRTIIEERSDKFVNYSRLYRRRLNDVDAVKLMAGRQTRKKAKNSIGTPELLLWSSERDNWNHLYLYNTAATDNPLLWQVTKGEWCVREVVRIDEKKNVIYFTACGVNKEEDPYLIHYYKINLDGTGMVCLTPEEGTHRARFSKDGQYLVDTYSKVDMPPVTVLRNASDGRVMKTLECADISKLVENGWTAPEVFTAKGRDGVTDIWGVIQRPTNFNPANKYPVIEYIYAGPGDAYTPKSFNPYNWNMTSLAELGFIVVQLDGMGTSWRGKKFEEVCYKNLKDAGFPDRELWIKAAAAKYPYMDAENVGIFGASAGGQESTTAVLLHGDFYKAAYSSCGCHDNRMDKIWWNEQWMSYPVDSSYVESSNVYNAHKLERPLMLVVGELDDNVDPASTMQVVDALVSANKDFELVVLPGVHHTMGERYGEHKRYDFFVKNLLHVEPPKWSDVKVSE